MIRKPFLALCAALPLMTLAACGHTDETVGRGSLSIASGAVHISVRGAPKATIKSDGGLLIGRRIVPLNPAEQALARHYYQDALAIGAAGKATGEAGGKLGISVVGSLFSAMWHDNSAIIKRTAKQGAAGVAADVRTLCAHLAGLEAAQNTLAADQPAFAPYRIIRHKNVTDCRKGTGQHAIVTYAY
jgi:hypothetical protein